MAIVTLSFVLIIIAKRLLKKKAKQQATEAEERRWQEIEAMRIKQRAVIEAQKQQQDEN